MAVVLKVVDHPVADRHDLVHEAIASTGVRRRLTLKAPPESVDLTVEAWTLGSTRFLRTVGTSMRLTRTARDVRVDVPEIVAIVLAGSGCTYSGCGSEQVQSENAVALMDFTTPYAFAHAGPRMDSFVAHISHADLGVGVDAVRPGFPRLPASPLLPLVRAHLVQMSPLMDDVATNPAAVADLAAAHHVSLRTLDNLGGDQGETLADRIVRERLERVHRELALITPTSTIFAVARKWGFVDQGHFSHGSGLPTASHPRAGAPVPERRREMTPDLHRRSTRSAKGGAP